MMKKLRRLWLTIILSKTHLFAAALAGLSTLQLAIPTFIHNMTAEMFTALGVGIAAAIALLRSLTTESTKAKIDRMEKK